MVILRCPKLSLCCDAQYSTVPLHAVLLAGIHNRQSERSVGRPVTTVMCRSLFCCDTKLSVVSSACFRNASTLQGPKPR